MIINSIRKVLLLFVLVISCIPTYAQVVRKHFFEKPIPITDSIQLISIVENPESEIGRLLGNRIISDTLLFKKINENWFQEVTKEQADLITFCLPDIHFFLLKNNQLIYLSGLNSQCSPDNWQCNYIDSLSQYGDKIKTINTSELINNSNKSFLFNENYIGFNLPYYQAWYYCATNKYPKFYYDYTFKHVLSLNSNLTVKENIENFLRAFKSDLRDINYNAWENCLNDDDRNLGFKKYLKLGAPCDIEVEVFLMKNDLKHFKKFSPKKIEFPLRSGNQPILYYKK